MQINSIERVQKSFTKRLQDLGDMSHASNIEYLELRRITFDLTIYCTTLRGFIDLNPSDFFNLSTSYSMQRGYQLAVDAECYTRQQHGVAIIKPRIYRRAISSIIVEMFAMSLETNERMCLSARMTG